MTKGRGKQHLKVTYPLKCDLTHIPVISRNKGSHILEFPGDCCEMNYCHVDRDGLKIEQICKAVMSDKQREKGEISVKPGI